MTSKQSQKTSDLTVVIPTKNSEAYLTKCLESIKTCKEVIVVDSNSKDKTKSIVDAYGRTYIKFEWNKKYPKKRAWVLDNVKIKTQWVLMLDSDECVSEDFLVEFNNQIINSKHNGFWIKYNNYFLGKLLRFGIPQRKLALIRKESGTYEDFGENDWTKYDMEIHEHLLLKGTIGKMKAKLSHLQNETYDQMIEKHFEYALWEAKRHASFERKKSSTFREKIKYSLLEKFYFPYLYFFVQYIIFLGFLDGFSGYKYAEIKFKYFKRIHELLKQ